MSDVVVEETDPDPLNTALVAFTGAVGEAFDDVCTYAFIIGDSYVPFAPDEDEDCEDGDCSQLWVRVTSVGPSPTALESFGGEGCALTLDVGLEVGIIRCIEIVEEGEAPGASDMLAYATQAMQDMKTIMCAAMEAHEDAGFIYLTLGQWTPMGPMGGEYGGSWTMSAQV